MDLKGPFQVESIGGKKYAFICVDDYSRYSWVDFLREKSDVVKAFITFCTMLQREKGVNITLSEVTMEGNSRTDSFLTTVRLSVFIISSLLLSHLSRMELLSKRIDP